MSRTIPSDLKPSLYRLYSKPIQMVDLYLEYPYTSPSHFYCVNNEDKIFNGNTYVAIAAKRSSIKSEEGTVLQEITVQLDNIDLEFRSLVASGMFNRKRVDIKIVFDGYLSNPANYIMLYSGFLDAPSGDNRWVTLTVKPFPIFERDYPRRLFQVMCNWSFCDSQCTLSLDSFYQTGTIQAGSSDYVINWTDGDAGRAADYFVPGYMLITSGTLDGEVRPITASNTSQITLRVALSQEPSVGTTFRVQKLCAKNVSACKDTFNNYLNYGGFPHVPMEPKL